MKTAVVYWSGTGNTEAMAKTFVESLIQGGHECDLIQCSDFDKSKMQEYDFIAFGCPAMGDEVLEEGEFEPMFESLENDLKDKKVAIFGSYEWADGEWMRKWEKRCKDKGINLICEGITAYDYPSEDDLNKIREAAKLV